VHQLPSFVLMKKGNNTIKWKFITVQNSNANLNRITVLKDKIIYCQANCNTEHSNITTIQQSNNPTIQQSNNPTIQQFNHVRVSKI
jgi:hypothetical protein